jgi:hypothetical protein
MDRRIKHGMSKSKLYRVWANMKYRCYKPNHPDYKHYGARGIRVCRAWHDSAIFFQWAKRGYREGLTLDRKNNNKGYSPLNCRWITLAQQTHNQRSNVWVIYKGKRMIETDAAKAAGINKQTLAGRRRRGNPPSQWFHPL